MARRNQEFQTLRSEGGLLPPDLLRRVVDPKSMLKGLRPEDYGLPQSERINEVVTQSWNRLRKHWGEFQAALAGIPTGDAATGVTNDKWTLPLLRELGFGLLPTSAGPEVAGRHYAISRFFGPVPVHLVGAGVSLDRRAAGIRGAAVANPHGLVQEFLNRSQGHLWAIVSNGLQFRVLRDNQALSRQAFLEFDLEAMFAGEVYADFVLLWLAAHATRFAPRDAERAESCWLEQWTKEADEQGTRALGELREGVQKALEVLGAGFSSHSRNSVLRESLRTGTVTPADLHGQLLRIVYRLILLFVAEDRTIDGEPLLHPRDASESAARARQRYADHYSTARLRSLAGGIKGSRHGDLWRQFQTISRALSTDEGSAPVREQLALPVMGSFLWDPESTAALNQAELSNFEFLYALRHLAFTRQGKTLRPVDYRNLGAEELGGVYESLLALTPQVSPDGSGFTFAEFAGNERKTSGSYYTPDSLVQCLLDSALDPVVDEALKGKSGADAERALLALKVCDPAVGSGHFLVGAAHRLARHLARVRALTQGDSEPSPLQYQHALRDVIGRCLYGVDLNPMAAELCRVSLWLEALDPGKPLSFLDHHIRVGNSLLGATPKLIAAGLPDETFATIEGDDKNACAVLKKRNKAERKGLGPLFAQQDAEIQARLYKAAAALEELPDDRPEDIRAKELAFRRHEATDEYRLKKKLADAWCAAFVIRKHFREPGRETSAHGITQKHLNAIAEGQSLSPGLGAETERLSSQYRFFHWHLAFPEVFAEGGFACVIGNPPWDQIQVDPREFFAASAPDIAKQQLSTDRDRLIEALKTEDTALHNRHEEAQRVNDGIKRLVHASGRYRLTSQGRLNSGPLFGELASNCIKGRGMLGMILPSGIATDSFTQNFFRELMQFQRLASFFEFENEGFFEGAGSGHMVRFALTTITGTERRTQIPRFMFHGAELDELNDPSRVFTLTHADVTLINPNTRTCPVFRTTNDAELTKAAYRRHEVLVDDNIGSRGNPWGFESHLMFMTNTSSELLKRRDELDASGEALVHPELELSSGRYLRYFQAKMVYQFNHRHGDFALLDEGAKGHLLPRTSAQDLANPWHFNAPRYWVSEKAVDERLDGRWSKKWLVGWRDVTDARASARTTVSTVIPRVAVDSQFILAFVDPSLSNMAATLPAIFNSYVFDYLSRQKIGGTHLRDFVMKQLPVLPPVALSKDCPWQRGSVLSFLIPYVLELIYTAWDLEPFAQDSGWFGPPFRWDEGRRFWLRCELDAAFFHLYLPAEINGEWALAERETTEDLSRLKLIVPTPRDASAYIMDTFPIVRRRDEEHNGDYHTKRVILEIYDAMQEAIRTGQPYRTRLDPPPADPRCCHPPRAE